MARPREEEGGGEERRGAEEHPQEQLPLTASQPPALWRGAHPPAQHGHDCSHQGEEQERCTMTQKTAFGFVGGV